MPNRARSERAPYASARDLRRSFGEREAMRDLPPVRRELRRHEDIQTTLPYYVGAERQRTGDVFAPKWQQLWQHGPRRRRERGPWRCRKQFPENELKE